jgi:ornithine--oxo-acid transaminase
MGLDIKELIAEREIERYRLHSSYLNEQMVHVLKTIGFDRRYQRGVGQYLYDERGEKYLDLLSGWGVFAIGRNHPTVREALKAVLDSELPNLVQMDVSVLSGVLAERLLGFAPHLDKVFPIPGLKLLRRRSNLPVPRLAVRGSYIAVTPSTV